MPTGTRGVGNTKGALSLEDRSKLSLEIRNWRLGAGWSQHEAAKFIGVSAYYFSILECQSKMTPPKLNFAYIRKFRDGGLDLEKAVPGLEISTKRVKGIMPTAQDISMKGNDLEQGFNKAMDFMIKAKDIYERKIASINQFRADIDSKIETLMAESEELDSQKKMLKDKIHKTELGIENIKLSMLPFDTTLACEKTNEVSITN
jgi:transcriptional regulator with XRE-family HTH domain